MENGQVKSTLRKRIPPPSGLVLWCLTGVRKAAPNLSPVPQLSPLQLHLSQFPASQFFLLLFFLQFPFYFFKFEGPLLSLGKGWIFFVATCKVSISVSPSLTFGFQQRTQGVGGGGCLACTQTPSIQRFTASSPGWWW